MIIDFGLHEIMIAISCFIVGAGLMFVWQMNKNEFSRDQYSYKEAGEALVEVRVEYDAEAGGVYYVIHNKGNATAHDVRAYLPKAYENASKRKGPNCQEIAAGLLKITMKRYDKMNGGEKVEIPLIQIPPTEESRKSIYSMGLDIELRWSNIHGDVTQKEYIVPVFSKKRSRVNA